MRPKAHNQCPPPSVCTPHSHRCALHVCCRYVPSQIKAGDELFSPFVAAGWKSAVEGNMRPAQWLGFLKIMTALGAEYVETGYFAPLVFNAKWKNVQLPQNYVPLSVGNRLPGESVCPQES